MAPHNQQVVKKNVERISKEIQYIPIKGKTYFYVQLCNWDFCSNGNGKLHELRQPLTAMVIALHRNRILKKNPNMKKHFLLISII